MLRLILPLALGTVLSAAVVAFATGSLYKPVGRHRAIDQSGLVGFLGPIETPTASSGARRAKELHHAVLSLN
jgi:hypothetical protein